MLTWVLVQVQRGEKWLQGERQAEAAQRGQPRVEGKVVKDKWISRNNYWPLTDLYNSIIKQPEL